LDEVGHEGGEPIERVAGIEQQAEKSDQIARGQKSPGDKIAAQPDDDELREKEPKV